jgi:hypothetical protein
MDWIARHNISSRMVIANLDIERLVLPLRPLKTDTPLPVNANAELPFPVTAQRLKAIAGE